MPRRNANARQRIKPKRRDSYSPFVKAALKEPKPVSESEKVIRHGHGGYANTWIEPRKECREVEKMACRR